MKGKLIRIGIALIAMSSCLALAQDKGHHRDKKHHQTKVQKRVSKPRTSTYTIHHRGGSQTVTTYNQRKYRTGRTGTTRSIQNKARPYYHPNTRYTKAEWEARIRDARRYHRTTKKWPVRTKKRTGRVIRTRHDNGLHRGWYIGKGNPHRTNSKWPIREKKKTRHEWPVRSKDKSKKDKGHDKDRDKDRDHDGDRGHQYMMSNSGFQLASWQGKHSNYGQRRQGGDRRNSTRKYYAAGHYTNVSRWARKGQEFVIRYVINLSSDGKSRLEATSLQDRNMPNNDRNTDKHGDILRYMHSGHDVIQNGTWSQNGTDVTIRLTKIRYGGTDRSKSETLRGHLTNGTLHVSSFDRNFYGDQFNPTFKKD